MLSSVCRRCYFLFALHCFSSWGNERLLWCSVHNSVDKFHSVLDSARYAEKEEIYSACFIHGDAAFVMYECSVLGIGDLEDMKVIFITRTFF